SPTSITRSSTSWLTRRAPPCTAAGSRPSASVAADPVAMTPMDDLDREAILATFLAETEEGLAAMEQALVVLESQPADSETISAVFRVAHTLKGNASSLGLAVPAEFAHGLEDMLDRLRSGAVSVTAPLISLLLQAVDALRMMVPDAVAGAEGMKPIHRELLGQLAGWVEREDRAAEGSASATAVNTSAGGERGRSLRVDVAKLDRMLNLSGEISIGRGRLAALLERHLEGAARESSLDALRELSGLFGELQEEITRVRMVPVGPTFRGYARSVRDVAAAHGKSVRLVIEGEDVEVDTSVIEMIRDPLTHLVRNAVDHGIEAPALRAARGKDRTGTITLRARHEAGRIVIELSDDGAGLGRERILARARAMGRIDEGETLADTELHRLLFEPGFSTAEVVSDLSGRGVGMDVVRRNVEALRGSVGLESAEGHGTTVTIRLPLTLAIIRGFLVAIDDETYVIPLEAVTECVD